MPRAYPLVASNLLCGHRWRLHGGSAWIAPVPGILDRLPPPFDPAHPLVEAMDACLCGTARALRDGAFLGAPPMLDGPTALSQLLGGEAFPIALAEEPERVGHWLDAWTGLMLAAQAHFQATVAACGPTRGAFWLPVCAPGTCEAVQCDAAVLMTPRMFTRFVMPGLRRHVASLDHALYHLDGVEQCRFLEQLATIEGLDGIQWNPQPNPKDITEPRIDVFRAIRARGWRLAAALQ